MIDHEGFAPPHSQTNHKPVYQLPIMIPPPREAVGEPGRNAPEGGRAADRRTASNVSGEYSGRIAGTPVNADRTPKGRGEAVVLESEGEARSDGGALPLSIRHMPPPREP